MTTNNKPQYGWPHQKRRAEWAKRIAQHPVACGCTGGCGRHDGTACQTIITPGTPWHLGHGIPHSQGGDGTDATPWCIPCNLADGARLANSGHHPAIVPHSRNWWPELGGTCCLKHA